MECLEPDEGHGLLETSLPRPGAPVAALALSISGAATGSIVLEQDGRAQPVRKAGSITVCGGIQVTLRRRIAVKKPFLEAGAPSRKRH
jgi:hypothetical protein